MLLYRQVSRRCDLSMLSCNPRNLPNNEETNATDMAGYSTIEKTCMICDIDVNSDGCSQRPLSNRNIRISQYYNTCSEIRENKFSDNIDTESVQSDTQPREVVDHRARNSESQSINNVGYYPESGNRFDRNIARFKCAHPKVAACCLALWYLTMTVAASPMPPRLRSEQVARYINFTKTTGKEPSPTTFLTTSELIAARSLVPEEHYIISEDGYILKLYRLYNKKLISPKRPPVLIMHGLLASSDSWLVGKRSTSLPIVFADMGYDVWLGDQRGNANSKKHVYLNTRSPQFWNFSFHESGYYDLPAFVDHILSRTGHKQLIYVGHSMATAAFLVMTSTRPEYNSKIKLSCLMAPVAYLRRLSELDNIVLQFTHQADLIIRVLKQVGLYEVLPRSVTLMQLTNVLCSSTVTQPLCILAIRILFQQNPKNLDRDRAGFIFSYVPAGSSLKMFDHFAHNIKSSRFQNYDYGEDGNMMRYGTRIPQIYDLKRVTCPVALYYSLNDIFLNKRTVLKTAQELPNLVRMYEIPDKKYSHADYVLGLNSKEVLFNDMLKLMGKFY